ADLDRAGMRRPVGRGGELDRDLAPIFLVHEADQRLADQVLRHRPDQFAERAVGLFEPAEAVDQRDADRRVGKKALEALARQAQRRLPLALRGQVANHRAGAQIGARADRALADRGMDDAAVMALQRDLAVPAANGSLAAVPGAGGVARKSWSTAPLPTISAGVRPSQRARVWLTNRKRPSASTE